MRYCANESRCFNPAGMGVLLYDDDFHENKKLCKHCIKIKNAKHYKNKVDTEDLYDRLRFAVNESNKRERLKESKNKYTPYGQGKHKNLYSLIIQRIRTCNNNTEGEMITIKQAITIVISADYTCPVTGDEFGIDINLGDISLDHIICKNDGGDNKHDNIIFCHNIYNLGKNGYQMFYTLDTMLKIAYPGEINKEKRRLRALEIIDRIYDIHQIYPKVYEKIEKMTKKELKLTLQNRMSVTDLLNT